MFSSNNNKSQAIIDLNKILYLIDWIEIKRMETEFITNGWCFVLLPTELIPDLKLVNELSNFFESNDRKTKYSQIPPIYGYSKVNHKEGIKLLTGSYFGDFAYKGLVPAMLVQPLNYLSQVLDTITKRLIEILDQHLIFQQKSSLSSLIKYADLPLEDEHFGMVDIVSYFNDKSGFKPPQYGQSTEEVNCVPHYDPGLFSISILSTHEGLQLLNMTNNEWIDGPLERNIGVIWLGEAASRVTQNRLKPGIHRVIYPQQAKHRLTLWYEVCTIEQLRNISADSDDEPMDTGTVTFENLPESASITVLPGEKKLDFLKRVEMATGLSTSKMGPVLYQLEKHVISYPTTSFQIKKTSYYSI
ncbi:unnamed protein product [Adineta steineri]|uniref:Isopenicillin N synthase-like Fe(2+) 2OG dioxygenase domain-containing protein n=1 Tax=Adineta steineri TaxID=433720 RepID=A0A815ACA3_9BILA|nr:unnamed protein product [Adineta steineri]CAF1255549.1 unnamed protein product [Adineta steineri]CAF3890937.1 unnamed protein product [Adineta steineri]CAF3965117.1 unnamed protein product [Adineta steineri]